MLHDSGLGTGCGPRFYGAFIVVFMIILLTGCKTVKSVENHTENNTELKTDSTSTEKEHKDSTNVTHNTNTTEKEKSHTESHKEKKDSVVTVVDQNGNVIGFKEYHWIKETLREMSEREKRLEDSLLIYRQISDSISFYKEKMDSLSNIVNDSQYIEVEKKQSLKDRLFDFFKDAVIVLVLFLIFKIVLKLVLKKYKTG